MEELETLGCLGIGETDTDYLLCDWDIDILPKLYKQDDIRFEYNQWANDWSQKSCTIFGAVWMSSDLMNYEYELAEIKEIDEESYNRGRIPWNWWLVKDAVDLNKDWWNSNKKLVEKYGQIAYYRVSKSSNMVDEILGMKYTMDTNFCPTTEYNMDYRADAILNGNNFWTKTNGHCVDVINNWKRGVKDSYKWRKTYNWKLDCNIYALNHKIAEITNFWPRLYVYTKVREWNLERLKELNEFRTLLIQTIENNSAMRHKTNDVKYQKELNRMNIENRKKLKDIDEQVKLLS